MATSEMLRTGGWRNVKVLVVTQYFPPEIGAPQARLSEFARAWARMGADVQVLTGMPNHPTGRVPPGYRGRAVRVEACDGYGVVRTWLYATPNEGVIKKTLAHMSFMVTSVVLGWRHLHAPDVVVVSSPTFFSMFSAWLISKLRRARLVVEVRDLWPALFVELGVLQNQWIIRILEALEMGMYRAADEIVVVSEGFRDSIASRGIPAEKIHTVPNGVDVERFDPTAPRNEQVWRELGVRRPNDVLVLYIGAHGISQGLTAIADAASKIDDERIRFAFVGEGAAKRELAERVKELGLHQVTMLPGVPRERVPEMLAAADICLAPLRDVPIFGTFIPSKIFEYMGAGKAIVGSVRGEAARILRLGGAVVVEPENPSQLAEAIGELAGDASRRAAMGVEGRRYVENEFDREKLAGRYFKLLERVVRQETGK